MQKLLRHNNHPQNASNLIGENISAKKELVYAISCDGDRQIKMLCPQT